MPATPLLSLTFPCHWHIMRARLGRTLCGPLSVVSPPSWRQFGTATAHPTRVDHSRRSADRFAAGIDAEAHSPIYWTTVDSPESPSNREELHACFLRYWPRRANHSRSHRFRPGCHHHCDGRRPNSQAQPIRTQLHLKALSGLWPTRVTPRYDLPAVWRPTPDAAIRVGGNHELPTRPARWSNRSAIIPAATLAALALLLALTKPRASACEYNERKCRPGLSAGSMSRPSG
jgi:hypothetical protein